MGNLILTRWVGETICIGDNIRVTVCGTRGQVARIGIGAPREVSIHREEVYHRVQLEKAAQAAQANSDPGMGTSANTEET